MKEHVGTIVHLVLCRPDSMMASPRFIFVTLRPEWHLRSEIGYSMDAKVKCLCFSSFSHTLAS